MKPIRQDSSISLMPSLRFERPASASHKPFSRRSGRSDLVKGPVARSRPAKRSFAVSVLLIVRVSGARAVVDRILFEQVHHDDNGFLELRIVSLADELGIHLDFVIRGHA